MKSKLAILVLASTVALSGTTASARVYRHSHDRNSYNSMNFRNSYNSMNFRNSYNSMNMTQARSDGPLGYYGPSGYYGPALSEPGDSSLSGTGASTFGGSGAGGGGGGP